MHASRVEAPLGLNSSEMYVVTPTGVLLMVLVYLWGLDFLSDIAWCR